MNETRKRPRGRPTTKAKPGQKSTLGIRVTPELKDRLDAVAKANDRSLSQEAEFRLERSFHQDDALGGPAMRWIVYSVIAAFGAGGEGHAAGLGHPDWTPAEWLKDRECYRAAMVGAIEALASHFPGGVSADDARHIAELVLSTLARRAIQKAQAES